LAHLGLHPGRDAEGIDQSDGELRSSLRLLLHRHLVLHCCLLNVDIVIVDGFHRVPFRRGVAPACATAAPAATTPAPAGSVSRGRPRCRGPGSFAVSLAARFAVALRARRRRAGTGRALVALPGPAARGAPAAPVVRLLPRQWLHSRPDARLGTADATEEPGAGFVEHLELELVLHHPETGER